MYLVCQKIFLSWLIWNSSIAIIWWKIIYFQDFFPTLTFSNLLPRAHCESSLELYKTKVASFYLKNYLALSISFPDFPENVDFHVVKVQLWIGEKKRFTWNWYEMKTNWLADLADGVHSAGWWSKHHSKKLPQKFFQNLFLECSWSV